MKKLIFGIAVILALLGTGAGVYVWTAAELESYRTEFSGARDVSAEDAQNEEDTPEPRTGGDGTQKGEAEAREGEAALQDEEQPNRLAYKQLDTETRKVYEEILAACQGHLDKVELSTRDETLIETAYEAVTSDHGELFWVNGYTYTIRSLKEQVKGIDFAPAYTCQQEDRKRYQQAVDETVKDYLARIPMDASDYEKVKYVYEILIYNVGYNLDSPENQNILSVFLYGESVCSGYASAVQYLLTLLRVPCMTVYGMSEGENHAWNLVCIDGEPYYVDVTWGSTMSETVGDCCYAYLNLTDRDMERTHVADMSFELPACTSLSANYYVQQDCYFTVFDERKVGEVLAASYEAGETSTAIKLASDDVYRQVCQTFITEQKAADYCRGLERLRYVENEEMRVLTFLWE